MKFELKNCINGEKAVYKTELEIKKSGDRLTFIFDCENSELFCCDSGYNKIHSMGDVCELLIGTDPKRGLYYEIEISPIGELMIAAMTNRGVDSEGKPILDIGFIDEPFVTAKCEKTSTGFKAIAEFDISSIRTSGDDVYFNAYRIETDGGEPEKHLFALNPTMQPKFHVPSKFLWLADCVD